MGPRAGEAAITPDCAEACARFGLFPAPTSGPAQAASPRWDDATTALAERDPRISLLSGDSGSGKSRFLGAFVRQRLAAGERVIVADPAPLAAERPRPVIECVGQGSVDARLGRLARAGLSEAALLARTPAELSEGERHRLALARAMAYAAQPEGTRRAWLVIDECCSVLDRATAQGVAHTLARWVRSDAGEIRLLAAGAHEDLPRLLGPDCVVRMPTCVIRNGKPARPPRVRIEDGTWDDYASLAHHQYRAGRPATRERVLCAHRRLPNGSTRIAGALVVSRPTLNGAHRQLAWPGRYHGAAGRDEQRAQAARINRELRCISRVVVEPASRGLGIAKRLGETRPVISVDMRNHGESDWSDSHGYPDMAQDLAEAIPDQSDLLGHSMGGKAAMVLARTQPAKIRKLIVADIAPVTYSHSQNGPIAAMRGVDLDAITNRADAKAQLGDLEPGPAP